jgi:hypothetical protein
MKKPNASPAFVTSSYTKANATLNALNSIMPILPNVQVVCCLASPAHLKLCALLVLAHCTFIDRDVWANVPKSMAELLMANAHNATAVVFHAKVQVLVSSAPPASSTTLTNASQHAPQASLNKKSTTP